MNTASAPYVFVGRQNELQRLLDQADDLKPESAWLLDHIGVENGWRVVDIGCGPIGVLDLLSACVGPMGKEPAMLAPLQARVSAVACHPKQDILAAGYSDGTILMVRLGDGAEILVRRRNGTAPVAALAWNAKGTLLAFAAEDGDAGLLEL
jgi:hypothetical protein